MLAVLAGAAAIGCGVGLFATAGWLIARAAEHPSILALSLAVVAVRGFGVGRGMFRYAERLLSHDAPCAPWGTSVPACTVASNGWPRPAVRLPHAATCWRASSGTSRPCRTW